MDVTLHQTRRSDDSVASLQHLLADVIILRLRRPSDREVAGLEAHLRWRLRSMRGLPPKPAPRAGEQLELFAGMAPVRPSRKRSRRKPG